MSTRALVAGHSLGAASGWNIANVGAIASVLADAYGVSLASIGLLTTALFVAHLSAQVPGGMLTDRIGGRRAGAIGLALISAGLAVTLIAASFPLGLAGRAITGLGTGLAFVAGNACVREAGGGALSQGIYGGFGLSTGGLALAVVPQVEGALGWRAPYLTSAAMVALGAVALAIGPAAVRVGQRAVRTGAGILADRRLRRSAVLYSASFGLAVVSGAWIVELLYRNGALGAEAAGAVGGTTLLLGIVSRPLGGLLLQRRPEWVRAVVGASLVACALGTSVLLVADRPAIAVASCALLGFSAGVAFSPVMSGAAAMRPDAPAAAVGLVNSAAILTILVATPLVGLTFSLPGDGRIGFGAIALLWALALALLPSREALGAVQVSRRPVTAGAPD